MSYAAEQNKCNFKIGEEVMVMCGADSYQNGWGADWSRRMDELIGLTGRIVKIDNTSGIRLNVKGHPFEWCFPYFVLKKMIPEKLSLITVRSKITVSFIKL